MTTTSAARRLGLAGVAVLMLGCTTSLPELPLREPWTPSSTPRAAAIRPAECPADGAGLVPPYDDAGPYATGARAGTAPPGTTFVTVLRCSDDGGLFRSDGTKTYLITEQSAEPSPALMASLTLGDEPPPSDPRVACPARATPVLYLLLVDESETAYRPRIPQTWCGEPRDEVIASVDELSWTAVRRYRVEWDTNG